MTLNVIQGMANLMPHHQIFKIWHFLNAVELSVEVWGIKAK
jgi:hypothetical protein